jgi:L-lactate dehydrogenase (cytochrome)
MTAQILSVADARRRARRVLPRVVFDYVDGAADDEVTMAENEAAYRELAFRPRAAVDTGEPSLSTTVVGTDLSLPVVLAPTGLIRLMHPDGPAGAARAATAKGTVSVLSTVAGATIEDVADAAPGRKWFQLYAAGGRDEAAGTMDRAVQAGYEALVVTIDTPALGNRERDLRNGVRPPLRLDAHTAVALGPQVLARPVWAWRMLRDGVSMMGHPPRSSRGRRGDGDDDSLGSKGGGLGAPGAVAMLASPFSWSDIEWIRGRWRRPLLVKGVLSGDDARRAVNAGVDAVIVSNHGGRQLDGAPATARVLPEVVDAVGAETEVLVDGGVRRGGDVIKALALGARAVLIGRPYLYGLSVAGQPGVERILDILRSEMLRSMRLLGCDDVVALDRTWLQV